MKLQSFLVLAMLLAPPVLRATDFSLKIMNLPRTIMPGEIINVTAELANTSGHPLKIAYGATGFRLAMEVTEEPGGAKNPCEEDHTISDYAPGFTVEALPVNWTYSRDHSLNCSEAPATLHIRMVLTSSGPYADGWGKPFADAESIWQGKITSETITVQIVEPEGVDREVYQKFGHNPLNTLHALHAEEIIRDYPSSYYAGPSLMGISLAGAGSISEAAAMTREQRDLNIDRSGMGAIEKQVPNLQVREEYLSGASHHSERMKLGRQQLEQWANAAGKFLKAHPDYRYSPAIRRTYAKHLYSLGRDSDALDELRLLARQSGKEADEAKAYLVSHHISLDAKPWWQIW